MLTQSTIVLLLAVGAPNPADELTELLSAIHGITTNSNTTVQARATSVCANSTMYLPMLSAWLDPQFFTKSKDPLMRLRTSNAVQLAVYFCGKPGRDMVATRLKEVRTLRDTQLASMKLLFAKGVKSQTQITHLQALKRSIDQLMLAERTGLLLFTVVKDPRLVGDLVPRINKDTELSLQMVQYFIAAAPGDKHVRAELNALNKSTLWRPVKERIKHYLTL